MKTKALALFERLSSAVHSFEHRIEVEADERLYCRPLLETQDLLLLHVRQCFELLHRQGPAQTKFVAEKLGLSESRTSTIESKCESVSALDKNKRVTAAVGRVAVSVVQYAHHEWMDKQFSDLECADLALRHPSKETLLPHYYGEVRSVLRELGEALGTDAGLRRLMVIMLENKHVHRMRDLAATHQIASRTLNTYLLRGKQLGFVDASGKKLTSAGVAEAKVTRELLLDWDAGVVERLHIKAIR